MAYQRIQFGKGRLEEFRSWMHWQLQQTLGDRQALEQKWKSQLIQWRARVVGDGTCDVPFVGASDIEMPLSAIHADPVYADFMQSLHAPKDFWSLTPIRPEAVDLAKPVQEFLSLVERRDIRMRSINQRALLDLVVHGTCIYKDSILYNRKKVQDYDEAGEIVAVSKLQFQPLVEHVPLQDFFIPAYAWNIDPDATGGAPWVAQRFRLTKSQFKLRRNSESPYLPAYEKKAADLVLDWAVNLQAVDPVLTTREQEDEFVPWRDEKVVLYEIWVRFDADGDGIDEDLVVTWHHETRQVLRATFIPLVHGKRPFEAGNYLPAFGFYGMGVTEVDEWAQRAISRLLNETINNASLANTVMLGVPLGANIMPDEAIYPGKIWPLGPNERISEIRMGQPYQGMFQIIGELAQWAEQRTAVSELRQGSIDGLPSRTPASTVMQLMGESNKRFDMIMSNLRTEPLAHIGQRALQNLIQISKTDPRYITLALDALGQEDGSKVASVLQGSLHDIESNFGIEVTATSSKVNKEVDKQNLISLAQFMAQVYPQQLQYAQAMVQMGAADPTIIAGVLSAAFNGTSELQRRLVEAYDIQNPQSYLPPPMVPPPAAAAPGMQPGMPGAAPMLPASGPQAAGPFAQGGNQLAQLLGIA